VRTGRLQARSSVARASSSRLRRAWQRQARAENCSVGIVEQLIVDSKRARDTEASLMYDYLHAAAI